MPFGDRYFGARYFGNRFFGPGADVELVDDISHVASATARTTADGGTSLVCAVPTGTQDGDMMVASVQGRNSSAIGAFGGMSGWTLRETSDGTVGHQHKTWVRIASSEPANYTVTCPSSNSAFAFVIDTFRPGAGQTISVEDSITTDDTVLDTTISSAGVTTTGDGRMVVTSFGVNDGLAATRYPLTIHGSHTQAGTTTTINSATGHIICHAYELRASAGATGARNAATAGGNSTNSTHIIVLTQAPTAPSGQLILQSIRD